MTRNKVEKQLILILGGARSGKSARVWPDRVNQMIASRADKVYLMVAGLALELKSFGARPFSELTQYPA